MRAIRRTDTKPELALRRALHQLGYRYRKDYRLDLAGGRRVRPDIAFTGRKVAVFVDGCFWHGCPEHGSKPRANEWYWGPKLLRNVERDQANDAALSLAGLVGGPPVGARAAGRGHRHRGDRGRSHQRGGPPGRRAQLTRPAAELWQNLGTMRVFLPSTLPALARALQAGQVGPAPLPGFAVTPALREAYASGDTEELEYAALTEAARASLRMLAGDPAAPSRRVVLAAEIPAEQVSWDAQDGEPARVVIKQAVPLGRLASAHVDAPEAGADVRSAADALPAADAGDEDARFTVDGAEGHELGWYATQELSYLAE